MISKELRRYLLIKKGVKTLFLKHAKWLINDWEDFAHEIYMKAITTRKSATLYQLFVDELRKVVGRHDDVYQKKKQNLAMARLNTELPTKYNMKICLDSLADPETMSLMKEIRDKLDWRHQIILEMRFQGNMTNLEIAKLLGCSEARILQLWKEVQEKIRREYFPEVKV